MVKSRFRRLKLIIAFGGGIPALLTSLELLLKRRVIWDLRGSFVLRRGNFDWIGPEELAQETFQLPRASCST
jgi:hypothetical protein